MSGTPGDDVRARFHESTSRHLIGALTPEVELRLPDSVEEHEHHLDALWALGDRPSLDPAPLFSDEERARQAALAALRGPPLEHRLLWVAGGEVIGCYWGVQDDHCRYYMTSTVLRPDYQGRGVYRAFLPRLVAAVRETGFHEIYSRHRADNNAVLVPKLKAGFVIAGFDVAPRHGLLVQLRLYLNEGLGRLFAYRIDGRQAVELRAAGLPVP
jgi:GNAT superfamily N-acetyltransferase